MITGKFWKVHFKLTVKYEHIYSFTKGSKGNKAICNIPINPTSDQCNKLSMIFPFGKKKKRTNLKKVQVKTLSKY